MNKKIGIFIGVFIGLGVVSAVMFLVVKKQATGSVQAELSDRSKEFLKSARADGTSDWNDRDFDQTAPAEGVVSDLKTPCYQLKMVHQVIQTSRRDPEAPCTFEGRVISPASRIVISVSTLSGPLAESSSVALRRRDPKTYTEVPLKAAHFENTLFFRGTDDVTIFAQHGQTLLTIAYSGMVQPDLLKQADLQSLIDSAILTQ